MEILKQSNQIKLNQLLACEQEWYKSEAAWRLPLDCNNKLEQFLYESYYLENPKLYHDIKDCEYRDFNKLAAMWDGRRESIQKLLEIPSEKRLQFTQSITNYLHSKSTPWDIKKYPKGCPHWLDFPL